MNSAIKSTGIAEGISTSTRRQSYLAFNPQHREQMKRKIKLVAKVVVIAVPVSLITLIVLLIGWPAAILFTAMALVLGFCALADWAFTK